MVSWNSARKMAPKRIRHLAARALGRDKLPRVRRFIPHDVGVTEFFASLRAADMEVVVLRWFDTLPDVAPGEDIDMLVADRDLPRLANFMENQSGAVPCDVYSAGGLPGSQYKQMPYFPAALATALLSRRQIVHGAFPVPSPQDHFDSLAYHAVYQKGLESGLPTGHAGLVPLDHPDHDYAHTLNALCDRLGLTVAISMEGLDEHLAQSGYRPDRRGLERLAKSNAWIANHLLA